MRLFYSFFILFLFSDAVAEPHIVDFRDQEIKWTEEADFYIEKVIVSQNEKDCIGFIQEAVNHLKAAYFNHTISEELDLLFKKTFSKKENSVAVIVRINKFFIYELNGSSSFELNFDIVTFQDSICRIQFSSGTVKRKMGIGDKKHLSNILTGFEEGFHEYYERRLKGELDALEIPKNSAFANNIFSTSFTKSFSKRQTQKGIYKSYNDFRNNRTDTSYYFKIIERDYSFSGKCAKMRFNEKEPAYEPWGFTDGTNYYININSQDGFYIPLQQYSNSEDFFTYYIIPKDYSGAAVVGAIGGGAIPGVIGGLIYAAIVSAQPDKEIELRLDLLSGKLKSNDFDEMSLIKNSLIFCHSKNSNSVNGIELKYDSNQSVLMPPNSYYILKKSPTREKYIVEFMSEGNGGSYAEIDLNKIEKQVYLIDQNKRGTIKIDELYDYMKSDYLNKIEFMNQVK